MWFKQRKLTKQNGKIGFFKNIQHIAIRKSWYRKVKELHFLQESLNWL